MDMPVLKRLVKHALQVRHGEICTHIKMIQHEGRRKGIESAFARAFEAEPSGTKIEHETPLSVIQTKSYYPGRPDGKVDCYLSGECTAFEYKAVRLPRQHSDSAGGALYDIGQLASDYLRLNRARTLNSDTSSPSSMDHSCLMRSRRASFIAPLIIRCLSTLAWPKITATRALQSAPWRRAETPRGIVRTAKAGPRNGCVR